MKKLLLLTTLLISAFATAQIKDANAPKPANAFLKRGYQVQQSTISFDEQTLIVSAIKPGESQYDLFVIHHNKAGWSAPERLGSTINTEQDELWPSLSSNEQELYFVRRIPATDSKKEEDRYVIMTSHRTALGWSEAQSILISSGADISPRILDDNITLLYSARRLDENGRRQPTYQVYYTRKVNKYDWYDPHQLTINEEKNVHFYGAHIQRTSEGPRIRCTRQTILRHDTTYTSDLSWTYPVEFMPQPVMVVEGTITDNVSSEPIHAQINVYNALTNQLIAPLVCDGSYRIALPKGYSYLVDINADSYSHSYLEYDCRQLANDTTVEENILLSSQIAIQLNAFDHDVSTPINVEHVLVDNNEVGQMHNGSITMSLPIGSKHIVTLQSMGYNQQDLNIDAEHSVLLYKSELDIDLMAGKAPLQILVRDVDTHEMIEAQINLTNLSKNEQLTYADHATYLRQGNRYAIHTNAVGYIYADTIIDVPYSDTPIQLEYNLQSIQKNLILQLRNIQFEYNSASLMEESFVELDKVEQLMQLNPDLRIELSAHTDDQGSDQYNNRLSQRRGESVRDYLIKRGIASERITAVGYGKRKPLVPNTSDANRAINRRVEFKIL